TGSGPARHARGKTPPRTLCRRRRLAEERRPRRSAGIVRSRGASCEELTTIAAVIPAGAFLPECHVTARFRRFHSFRRVACPGVSAWRDAPSSHGGNQCVQLE